MKIEFIIYSHFFKERGMKVKGDWNFPHLPSDDSAESVPCVAL